MTQTTDIEGELEALLARQVDLLVPATGVFFTPRLCSSIRAAHQSVDAIQAAVTDSEPDALDAAALKEDLRELERLKRRVDAARLQLVAKAQEEGVPERNGFTDTGSWLAGTTKGDRRNSASDADLADAIGTGAGQEDGLTGRGKAASSDSDEPDSGPTDDDGGSGAATRDDKASKATSSDDRSDGSEASDDGKPDDASAGDNDGSTDRPRLTATGAALADGRISAEHAKVIAKGLRDLPEGLTPAQYLACEDELLALAVNRSPSQLRRAARRVLERIEQDEAVVDAHEDEVIQTEEERAMDASAFWIKDNHDGTMTGRFTVPWASGMILKKVIDAMTAPRRWNNDPSSDGKSHPGNGGSRSGTSYPGDTKAAGFDWQHKRGLAFADLLSRVPTDHLHTKVAATLLVTTRLEDLQSGDATTRVATTDVDGGVVNAGNVRRMACGAGIVPAVLGTDSVPIDLGRQTRLFTDAQRLALATRYTECAAENCDRPFAWTEIHHLRAWEHGGRTDVDNAVPLCGRHHHMIDSPRWRHALVQHDDGRYSIRYHRRT